MVNYLTRVVLVSASAALFLSLARIRKYVVWQFLQTQTTLPIAVLNML